MILLITLVSFVASYITLFSGFGLGSVLMPVLAIFFPLEFAIALTAFVHLVHNVFKTGIFWRAIDKKTTLFFGIPACLAAIAGAFFLNKLSALPSFGSVAVFGLPLIFKPVNVIVGLILIVSTTIELIHFRTKLSFSPFKLLLGGVLSGFFGGLSGHQGVLRTLFLLPLFSSLKAFVATSAAIALLIDVSRLTIYGTQLKLLFSEILSFEILLPTIAAIAGVLLGALSLNKITFPQTRVLIAVMIYILGILLIIGVI